MICINATPPRICEPVFLTRQISVFCTKSPERKTKIFEEKLKFSSKFHTPTPNQQPVQNVSWPLCNFFLTQQESHKDESLPW